jgi:transposase-like protein
VLHKTSSKAHSDHHEGGERMPKKVWTSKEKLQVVLDGVKVMTVPEICRQHGIAQPMCCRWADQFLANAESIFGNSSSKKESKLERENNQLRQIVADQALELKKCCDGKKKKNIRVGCNSQQRASLAYRIHQMRSSFLGIQESLCDNPLQAWP